MILFLLNLLPLILSFVLGILLIHLLDSERKIAYSLKILLGSSLGLGLSSYITFSSFLLFNQFNRLFLIIIHLTLLIFFIKNTSIPLQEIFKMPLFIRQLNKKHVILFFVLLICLIPTLYTISIYPNGGWDAWAAWNFKARTLLLGNEHWRNIFHPAVWQTNPNYPLFLPLLNVWGWIFSSLPTQTVPILISMIFSTLTLGLLFLSLKNRVPLFFNILLLLALSSLTTFYKFASSQYADIVIGYYLFACLYCLIQTKIKDNKIFALLSGLFLGVLSFTKNEGLLISALIFILAVPYLSWQKSLHKKKNLIYFLVGAFISLIPFIVFRFFYAPEDPKFINGFTSLLQPSNLQRLKIIGMFYVLQLKNLSGNGLWLVLLLGIILGRKQLLNTTTMIIPIFLILYGGALTLYYFFNTYFEIIWWLSVTFDRIIFSLLPIIFYWIAISLFPKKHV